MVCECRLFFERVGRLALGSRVRFLAEVITRDAAQIFEAYGTELPPKWFPVYYVPGRSSAVPSTAKRRQTRSEGAKPLRLTSSSLEEPAYIYWG